MRGADPAPRRVPPPPSQDTRTRMIASIKSDLLRAASTAGCVGETDRAGIGWIRALQRGGNGHARADLRAHDPPRLSRSSTARIEKERLP